MPKRCSDSARASPPIPPPTIAMRVTSLGRDALRLDEAGPALRIALDETLEFVRRVGGRVHALRLERGAHVGRRKDLAQVAVQALDLALGCSGRCEHAVPHVDALAAGARLRE